MRLFLDANVLFTAAHNPAGKAAFIIELSGEGAWGLFTSGFAAEEARRNLWAKHPASLVEFDKLLNSITIVLEQLDAPCPADVPEKDKPLFQAAYSSKATHLLTGDMAHFGRFTMNPDQSFGIMIMTPAQFLKSL